MPEFHSTAASAAGNGFDAFTAAYVMALYFTDTGEGDQPDSEAELAPEALTRIKADCAEFQAVSADLLEQACDRDGYTLERAGHDFWLTRNGHGAGFWDRNELDGDGLGDALTSAAKGFGEVWSYAGDDNLIYVG